MTMNREQKLEEEASSSLFFWDLPTLASPPLPSSLAVDQFNSSNHAHFQESLLEPLLEMQGEARPPAAEASESQADGIGDAELHHRAAHQPRPPPRPPRPLPPTIKKLYLYSTPTYVLVFGRSKDRQQWRVLRIERDDAGGNSAAAAAAAAAGGGGGSREATTATATPPSTPPPPPSPSGFFEPDFFAASSSDADGRPPLRASADGRVYDRASAAALLSSLSAEASAAGGKLRLLTRADAIVGCLRFSTSWHYLVVVTRKRLEAAFGGGGSGGTSGGGRRRRRVHKVYSVGATALVPLAEGGGVEGAAEEKYRRLLAGVELARGFYFSHTWPLWLTTQRAEEAAEAAVLRRSSSSSPPLAASSPSATAPPTPPSSPLGSPLPPGFCPFAELTTMRAPWKHRCVWNGHATEPLREAVAAAGARTKEEARAKTEAPTTATAPPGPSAPWCTGAGPPPPSLYRAAPPRRSA